jgi:hypothetical protein
MMPGFSEYRVELDQLCAHFFQAFCGRFARPVVVIVINRVKNCSTLKIVLLIQLNNAWM